MYANASPTKKKYRNIDENIEKLNDYNDDNVDEIVGEDIDANLYIPRDENTEV